MVAGDETIGQEDEDKMKAEIFCRDWNLIAAQKSASALYSSKGPTGVTKWGSLTNFFRVGLERVYIGLSNHTERKNLLLKLVLFRGAARFRRKLKKGNI